MFGEIYVKTLKKPITTINYLNTQSGLTNDLNILVEGSYSSDFTSTKQFVTEKRKYLSHNLLPNDNLSNSALNLESNISTDKFEDAISNSRGKTPGLDRIAYAMLRNIPQNVKKRNSK